ncbi:MAG: electron transfer flavoprotein subunit beta/FixA family protein [Candidatus Accumulibacter sp.]|jgi:electron transfer flavoprotein beta subunit|nr:electron transfer flavoprotein subunit beta/FixA family protein [Accumulibacter sp.]
MKIIVAVKRVLDYNVRVRVRTDESGVDIANARMSMNPFDETALEEAVRLKEAGIASEVIALSIGAASCRETLRTALAMGADRAILIQSDAEIQTLAAAKLLKALCEKEEPALVFAGKQAIDDDSSQVGQMLAALMDWPQAAFASKVRVEGDAVTVTREIDGGTETVELTLPALITADLRLNQPRYVTLQNIMKAKKKPLEVIDAEVFGVDLAPRLTTLKVVEAPRRAAGIKARDVAELVSRLKDSGAIA